jgi:predicted AAA+ superfamily ATPase
MEREIFQDLKKWKNSKYRKPLIIQGARQVGKTWLMKNFGERYYSNVVYLNFEKDSELKIYSNLILILKEF